MEIAGSQVSKALPVTVEADHRIANHLSILSGLLHLQAEQIRKKSEPMTGEQVGLVLKEFGTRVDTLSKLHRLLANRPDGAPVDVSDYLREVATSVVSCLSGRTRTALSFRLTGPCLLPSDKAVALGLLIGELVTNATKYAHPAGVPGAIQISSSRRDDSTIVFEVTDDGVGLPDGLDPLTSPSLGFRIIRALAEKVEGNISFENYGLGLNCVLILPCQAAALRLVS